MLGLRLRNDSVFKRLAKAPDKLEVAEEYIVVPLIYDIIEKDVAVWLATGFILFLTDEEWDELQEEAEEEELPKQIRMLVKQVEGEATEDEKLELLHVFKENLTRVLAKLDKKG